jgi:predicted ATP-dependent protease
VIIPRANAGDLQLRDDVVKACAAGKFQVFAVSTVKEALTILTNMPAGERDKDGKYPAESVLGVAVQRAYEYWRKASHSAPSPSASASTEESSDADASS